MKQCLIVLLSNLLIAQQSTSNYLVSYGKPMSCGTCWASLPAPRWMTTGWESQAWWDVVSSVRARRVAASPEGSQDGLSSWGILPTLMKSHLSFRGQRQTKKPSPSQPQKWAWPFLSLFSFVFYISFCSSGPVLSIPHIVILHLPFSHYLQTHWRHCGGNKQWGVHSRRLSLMLRLRCHGHEQPEKNLDSCSAARHNTPTYKRQETHLEELIWK